MPDLANVRGLASSSGEMHRGKPLLREHPVSQLFVIGVIGLLVININVFIAHQFF